ncbi:hypothetical protein D8Y22_08770 [Salinadaptatus halalkaliphilus]|uniref:Halobacterial output domain-containing protein n=1 Tax=Salinadaptatus halalkaliphilus TaxID=2419781 RepID=A0A4S3TNQ2_9EURY|nr:HalOD1 output domain-containing protein [Salinadaptatus halalkaliphilus]THE65280.1 hypothetical protein D8Y22_08770 [Salinadaptatus halalkaliphilus]
MKKSPGSDDGDAIARQQLDSSRDAPATQIVETIATLEGTDAVTLPPVYDCIDGIIADILSSPPSPEADATFAFTYQGYRIHVDQEGTVVIHRGSTAPP